MSELTNIRFRQKELRLTLLATASMLTLLTVVGGIRDANASEDNPDHSTVWVELGGQLEQISGASQSFSPPFVLKTPTPGTFEPVSPIDAERAPRFSIGGEGKVSLSPVGSDWTFAAAIRYGRSNNKKNVHQQTYAQRSKYVPAYTSSGVSYPAVHGHKTNPEHAFTDVEAKHSESHVVLDFQAGKDVGLGLLGARSSSVLSLGVRYAQLVSKTDVTIKARPDLYVYNFAVSPTYNPAYRFHRYILNGHGEQSVRAIGPSISLASSERLTGNSDVAQFTIDWGANAAILFGRRTSDVSHATSDLYFKQRLVFGGGYSSVYSHAGGHDSARSVVIPNLGGFAGISMKFPNAKVTLGYRADFFFGATDGGIDVTKAETLSFHGPFATFSIGLGG